MSTRTHVWLAGMCLLFGGVAGCGQSGGPVVQYVKGFVTLDGAPLGGATVRFSPTGSSGMGATGMTQDDGSFTLNAQAARPGAGTAEGEYAVTIQKDEYPDRSHLELSTDDPRYGTAEHQRLMDEADAAKPKIIVPRRYNTAETSGLSATVVKGSNSFRFELVSKEE
jgi:hypothetical protein